MRRSISLLNIVLLITRGPRNCDCFYVTVNPSVRVTRWPSKLRETRPFAISLEDVTEASRILTDWDRTAATNCTISENADYEGKIGIRSTLLEAVRTLNSKAADERSLDPTQGRCMLGICASSTTEGISALKSWVTNLELPRGLLHGMDEDGVPLELNGCVYIKYNSGGVYTFADIRKSQMGFNALWKPGDAMLEEYDGDYRGVYFQVELSDGEFRQYLLPLDLFDS